MTNKENNIDPLRNADIGTTRTIQATKDLETTYYLPEIYTGQDRISDPDVTNVEIVENDWGEQVIRLEFSGDVMKVLPRHWDYAREPQTSSERKRQLFNERYDLLKNVVQTVVAIGVPLGVGFWLMNHITPLQLEATTVPSPTFADVSFVIGIVVLMFVFIGWGARGGFPRV